MALGPAGRPPFAQGTRRRPIGSMAMFDFDFSKILIVGAIALIVVGPKDLPRVLRILGQMAGKLRRIADDVKKRFADLADQAGLDGAVADIEAIGRSTHRDIANNPQTAMRGKLPEAPDAQAAAKPTLAAPPPRPEPTYASPEMRSYFAPEPPAETAAAAAGSTVGATDEIGS